MPSPVPIDAVADFYNRNPYRSGLHPYWHPIRLATAAHLWGAPTIDPRTARLINIGCGSAEQLIALAAAFPAAEFVGVDVGEAHILRGRQIAGQLGLENLELIHGPLEQIERSQQPFDFVVAAGVYSWVSPPVRQELLPICRDLVEQNGVVAVSFNVSPGWAMNEVIRDLIRDAIPEGYTDNLLDVALDVLDQIIAHSDRDRPYSAHLAARAEKLRRSETAVLFEYVSPENTPVSLGDFVEDAARSGLRYFAEGSASTKGFTSAPGGPTPSSARDVVQDQALDRLRGTTFRTAIMVRSDLDVETPAVDRSLSDLHLHSRLRCVDQAGAPAPLPELGGSAAHFKSPTGTSIEVTSMPLARALQLLGNAWPGSVHAAEVIRSLGLESGHSDDLDRDRLLAELVQLHLTNAGDPGAIELMVCPYPVHTMIDDCPRVPAHVRALANHGGPIPSHDHLEVQFGPVLSLIAQQFDGATTPSEAAVFVHDAAVRGAVKLTDNSDDLVPDLDVVEKAVFEALKVLRSQGLLVASQPEPLRRTQI